MAYILDPFIHSKLIFFSNILLCNRCEAAAKSFVSHSANQSVLIRPGDFTHVHLCASDCCPSHSSLEAAEMTVALSVSFLSLKTTTLPCTIGTAPLIYNCNLRKEHHTEAINLQGKSLYQNTHTHTMEKPNAWPIGLWTCTVCVCSKYHTICCGTLQ